MARARTIVERIDAMHASLVEKRIALLSQARADKGMGTDADDLRRLRARANQPVAEPRTAPSLLLH